MSTYADYGPLLLSTDVDSGIREMLQTWLPTYLHRLEEERPGLDLARPKASSYQSVLSDLEFPDHALPGIFVTSSSTEDEPTKTGDGFYLANWNVAVSCVVRGQTPQNTRDLASLFEGCIRRIMVQQPLPWDGEVQWVGTPIIARVTDRSGQGRYLAAAVSQYVAYIDHAVQAGVGPRIPNDPYPDPVDPSDPTEPLVPATTVITEINAR